MAVFKKHMRRRHCFPDRDSLTVTIIEDAFLGGGANNIFTNILQIQERHKEDRTTLSLCDLFSFHSLLTIS